MPSIALKNRHISNLIAWLNIPLHGLPARQRGRFVKTLQDRLQELEEARLSSLKEFCDKDEQGNPVMERGDHYKLSPENLEKFQARHKEMMGEDYIIDVLDSNRDVLVQMMQIILNSKTPMDNEQSQTYDEICGIFEASGLVESAAEGEAAAA